MTPPNGAAPATIEMDGLRVGIGLPAAVPGTDGTIIGRWAAESEERGSASLGVIDRLVYDNLDPLVALAAAAARTERIELVTTVLNAGYRGNPVLLAKQIDSLERLCAGRLTVGLGMGGWPEDYAAGGVGMTGRGAAFEVVRREWARAGRPGRPRVIVERYFCLGPDAARIADDYVAHYYGPGYLPQIRPDLLTDPEHLRREIDRLAEAGADDLVLLPCSGEPEQIGLLADVLNETSRAAAREAVVR